MNAAERTALYRLYDADGVLLYVGIAKDPEQRWQGHAYSANSPWWPLVARKTVTWFPSREVADLAETEAIKDERPIHNRAKVYGRPSNWGRTHAKSSEINWLNRHLDSWSDQMARILRSEIAEGKIKPGDAMPTGKELFQRFGVRDSTCMLVLRRLADEGLIYQPKKGSRYFCADPNCETPPESTHVPLPTSDTEGEKPEYKVFRFAVNRPEQAVAAIRAKMTDEQWAAFVSAVDGTGVEDVA